MQEGAERAVSDSVRKVKGEFIFHLCDVSRSAQVQGLIARIVETYGCLDIVVNNAGIEGKPGLTPDIPEAD